MLIGAGLYSLFFTEIGLMENFTTQAWTGTKFEAGAIVLSMYQGEIA